MNRIQRTQQQPVLCPSQPGVTKWDITGKVLTNIYPLDQSEVLRFNTFRFNNEMSLIDKYISLLKVSEFFVLSENGQIVYSLSTSIGDESITPGPPGVIIDIKRLFRLLMIRESCLKSTVEFVLDRFVWSDLVWRLVNGGVAISAVNRRTLWDEWNATQLAPSGFITCVHGKAKREYKVVGLASSSAKTQVVEIKGDKMTVEEYFRQVVSIELLHPDAPLAVDAKGRFFPLELCYIRSRLAPSIASVPPSLFAAMNEILHPARLSIGSQPIKVAAHVLPPVAAAIERSKLKVCVIFFGPATEQNLSDFEIVHKIQIHDIRSWSEPLHVELAKLDAPVEMFIIIAAARLSRKVYMELKCLFDLKLGIPSRVVASREQRIVSLVSESGRSKPPGTCVLGLWEEHVKGLLISGVAMSTNQGFSEFTAQTRVGSNYLEEMLYEVCVSFYQINGTLPGRIVAFQRAKANAFTVFATELRALHAVFNRLAREVKTGINPKLTGSAPVLMPGITLTSCDWEGYNFSPEEPVLVEDVKVLNGISLNFFLSSRNRSTLFEIIHDTNRFSPAEMVTFTNSLGGAYPVSLKLAKKIVHRAKIYVIENNKYDDEGFLNQIFFDNDTLGNKLLSSWVV